MTVDIATAIQHFHAGRRDRARSAARAVLAQDPAQPTAMNLLAVCLFGAGQAAAAVPVFGRAARLQPLSGETIGNLAVSLQLLGRNDEAVARFRWLLAVQPGSTLALGRLAGLANLDGDLASAVRLLARTTRLAPDNAQEWGNLGVLSQAAGRLTAASVALRVGLALEPAGGGWAPLGTVFLGLGDVLAAGRCFSRALALDPNHRDAAHGRQRAARYLGAARAALDPGARPGLVVRAPLTSLSGYGHMAWRFLEHFERRGMAVHTIGVFGAEQRPGTEAPVRARVALHCLIPQAVEPVPGLRNVIFSMFEGPRVPPAWKLFSDRQDLVIVPCQASKLAWMEAGFPQERLRVCPLGVDPVPAFGAPLALSDRRGRPVASYGARILNISDFIARKNIDGVLRVWLRSTRASDDAVLILKLGKGGAAARAAFEALVARCEADVGRRLEEAGALALVDQRLSDEEMDGLYRASTHYWSLSHGEGWDLPLTRAGAFGLGLIAPDHSAYQDYLDPTVARLIPARVVPAFEPYGQRYYAPFHGLSWWRPDEEAAGAILAELAGGRGRAFPDARPRLLGAFGWERAVDRLRALLDEAPYL